MLDRSESEKSFSITQVKNGERVATDDTLAVEEPMEIRVVFGPEARRTGRSLAITMRTPDHDFELAVGFLFCEGIISSFDQIKNIEFAGAVAEGRDKPNIVRVELNPGIEVRTQDLQRNFYTTSSCGVCGKGSLDALDAQSLKPVESDVRVDADLICKLPNLLRAEQTVFHATGGIHAAGAFDQSGQLVCLREDVGRHNALDKLIGRSLMDAKLPMSNSIVVVSGRASFELLQKSLSASIPILVAVGAPSSLAVDLAERFGLTLIGFASEHRFNVYTHAERVS